MRPQPEYKEASRDELLSAFKKRYSDVGDPEIRAQAIAGSMLQIWACIEQNLNYAFAAAMRLGEVQALVICEVVSFRHKVKILQTFLSFLFLPDAPELKTAKKALHKLQAKYDERNHIAHGGFVHASPETAITIVGSVTRRSVELTLEQACGRLAESVLLMFESRKVQRLIERQAKRRSIVDLLTVSPDDPAREAMLKEIQELQPDD